MEKASDGKPRDNPKKTDDDEGESEWEPTLNTYEPPREHSSCGKKACLPIDST
jgi:hypothetical protein